MLNVNARSLANKVEEVEHILLLHSPDIMVITETWLHPNIDNSELCPPGYNIVRKDRASRGGGIAIFFKQSYQLTPVSMSIDYEVLLCKLTCHNVSLMVCAVYRPPNTPVSMIIDLNTYLLQHVKCSTNFILLGDFNLPCIDWDTLSAHSQDRANGEALIDLAFSLNLTQIINSPTRFESLLDLVFLSDNLGSKEYSFEVVEGISDHDMVHVSISLGQTPRSRTTVVSIPDFNRADDVSIIDFLELSLGTFEELSIECGADVEALWFSFKNIVNKCVVKYVPYRMKKTHVHNPWIDRDILHLKRRIARVRKKTNRNRTSSCRQLISGLTSSLKKKIRTAKEKFFNVTLRSFIKSSPQKFWRYISPRGKSFVQSNLSANEFNAFFKSVFTDDDGLTHGFRPSLVPKIDDVTITQEGVFNLLLTKVDTKKSAGPDMIPNTFLKRYAEWVSKYLVIMFRASIEHAALPSDWKTAKVIPVHKGGDSNLASNFRPISLTSTTCKLMEHIIFTHIASYLDKHNLIYKKQHGFRKSLSTTTQLIELTHDLAETINERGQTDVVFLDFSKAFDKVSHPKLIVKLSNVLKNSQITDWITAYLTNRTQYVHYKKVDSSKLLVTSGVPQGSVLGPLLFLVFINDIADNIDIPLRLFADDCIIYKKIGDLDDNYKLQKALDEIFKWCTQWQMKLNYDKTAVMTVSCQKRPILFSYNLSGQSLQRVNEFKYLGLIFNNKLNWNLHLETTVNKARGTLFALRRKLKFADPDTKLIAYKAFVRPILEYASSVWSPYTKVGINKLESIQKQAARFIYNNFNRNTSPTQLLARAQLQSLDKRADVERLKILYNILNGSIHIDSTSYLQPSLSGSSRLNHSRSLRQYRFTNDCYRYSFFPRAIRGWNNLSNDIVTLTSVHAFIAAVERYD